ncbi:hypothetical protein [Gelidibacter japonicus]|jgi:hypothetical protein|uniref:hypothetical protein n=1 Tax=Gelidibacter japonicus TaxID=1962232 RepID=UPI003A95D05D
MKKITMLTIGTDCKNYFLWQKNVISKLRDSNFYDVVVLLNLNEKIKTQKNNNHSLPFL